METQARLRARLTEGAKSLLREAVKVSWDLFKIMVPVIVLAKVLKEIGVVGYVGAALGPVMKLVGLPDHTPALSTDRILYWLRNRNSHPSTRYIKTLTGLLGVNLVRSSENCVLKAPQRNHVANIKKTKPTN